MTNTAIGLLWNNGGFLGFRFVATVERDGNDLLLTMAQETLPDPESTNLCIVWKGPVIMNNGQPTGTVVVFIDDEFITGWYDVPITDNQKLRQIGKTETIIRERVKEHLRPLRCHISGPLPPQEEGVENKSPIVQANYPMLIQ